MKWIISWREIGTSFDVVMYDVCYDNVCFVKILLFALHGISLVAVYFNVIKSA